MNDFNIATNIISSPLCLAARRGESDVVRQLLEKGHHVNLNDNRGWTPLHEAVAFGHLDCVRLLLQQDDCDGNACTFEGMSPMYVACEYQDNVELITLLVERGVNINKTFKEEITPLHVACKYHKLGVVKELVKHGAAINAQDFNNYTPLMEAVDEIKFQRNQDRESSLEVIRFLLDNGASISLKDLHGRTAFLIAVCVKWIECVQLLIDKGSVVDARDNDHRTAIFVAAGNGDLPLVKLLLKYEASPNVISRTGKMPIHEALHNSHVSVAEELVKIMDREIIAKYGRKLQSFLIFAIDSGSFECFKLVMDNKLYSKLDCLPFPANPISLDRSFCGYYKYFCPVSFLLCHHKEEQYAMPMLQCILNSGDFSPNVRGKYFIPPVVALIVGYSNDSRDIIERKLELFSVLLENGADIDYNSVKTESGGLLIPDSVRAAIIPSICNAQESILVPVLAHCFACNWDDIFDWLVKDHVCNAVALRVLIKLGIRSKQALLQVWDQIKHCQCFNCKREYPEIQKLVYEKDITLQSLCRVSIRNFLWQNTGKSKEAESLLHKMHIPLPIKQYIVPVKL